MDPYFVTLLGAFGASLLAFFTLLVKVFWTDPRDRKWATEDAEKKSKLVMAASGKDGDRVITENKRDTERVIDEVRKDTKEVKASAEMAYEKANTVNLKIADLETANRGMLHLIEKLEVKLDTVLEIQAKRHQVLDEEFRAAHQRIDKVEDATTTKGTP